MRQIWLPKGKASPKERSQTNSSSNSPIFALVSAARMLKYPRSGITPPEAKSNAGTLSRAFAVFFTRSTMSRVFSSRMRVSAYRPASI